MPDKDTHQTQAGVLTFLNNSNDAWLAALSKNVDGMQWPGEVKPIKVHIMSLAEHERLHHGQLISYFTLVDFDLPTGFKRNWAL